MRLGPIHGAVLSVLMVGIAGSAFAQGNTNDEVRKAVERAAGSSIGSAVAESLSRSIVSEGTRQMPATTIFGGPFYNRTDGDFSFGSFNSDTFGGLAGGLHKLHDLFLIHGALAGAVTNTEVTGAGDIDSGFFEARLGGDLIFLNTQPVKAWATLEGGISRFDSEGVDEIWAWRVAPSATFSVRLGERFLFEPTAGFAFSNTFEDDGADTTTTLQLGSSLKYRGERFRPQLNFTYQTIIDPVVKDNGFISVGPEILYAVTPSLLIGGAYTYGTSLNTGVDINSHTVTLEVRWTF